MATPLNATEPKRRELDARRLRTTATSATALQTPMISHVPSNPKKSKSVGHCVFRGCTEWPDVPGT